MAKECPTGTVHEWSSGWVIKASDPIPPYFSGWLPLKTSDELERVGRECDAEAKAVQSMKLPINGEKFLDHSIDEFLDEDGEKPFVADNFKQYDGYYGAGRYSFRNEFSRLFMNNTMKLASFIANALCDANDSRGGDKHNDLLSNDEKKEIRARARLEFKEDDNNFTVAKAEKLQKIISRTSVQVKEGLTFKDDHKREVYEAFKIVADSLPEDYLKIREKRKQMNDSIAIIDSEFADNWGVRESCKDYIKKKFSEYVKKYSDQIAKDSLDEQMEHYGVTIDMPTDEFYSKIYEKINPTDDEYNDFKELIYLRFLKKYNKTVEGDWTVNHLPAIHNLELAINELPAGHFLTNDYLNLITNTTYKGGTHGGYAWYDVRDSRINFSADCIDRGSVFGMLANPTEFKSTLYHEVGHAVSKKLGRSDFYDYKKFVVDCGWTYESKELQAGMTATGTEKDITRTGSNSHVKLISDYAGKSPEEAFAEYYSFYATNKERIDKYLILGDKEFLKGSSKIVCDTETSERTISTLGMKNRMYSDDNYMMDTYRAVKERLTFGEPHEKIELVSPWNTTLSKSEKLKKDVEKLGRRKDYSIDSMPPVVSYMDGAKNVVIDGATRVEVSRMNKKLVPSITITKEFYHKLKDHGMNEHEIADCVYTHNRHERVLREISPKVTIHGLIHRDNLIPVSIIAQNTDGLRSMQKIYRSKELQKAMLELFGNTVDYDIEKAWKKSAVGTVVTHKDGTKYKKVSETGDAKQDWQLVKKDKGTSTEEAKKVFSPKELTDYAKQASETNLQSIIKNSGDAKLREAAHNELERRQNEEHPQEKDDKGKEKPAEKKQPEKKDEKKTEAKKPVEKKEPWMNELDFPKTKRKVDILNDIDKFKEDEQIKKLIRSFDNADYLKGFCDTISQKFAEKLVNEGVDSNDIQLIEGIGLKNGLGDNPAKLLMDTNTKFISHVVVKIGDKIIDLTGKQFGDKYSGNVIPYSEFKSNWGKVKDFKWEHSSVKKIREAIELGKYEKAISEGKMTASDAKKIIESAGLEVPKEIVDNEEVKKSEETDINKIKKGYEKWL